MGILGKTFNPNTPEKIDFWLRILDVISDSSCETLEPYIVNEKMGIRQSLKDYETSIKSILEKDKLSINALICVFELISDKGTELLGLA
jgi:hypothetical protein